MTSAPRKKNSYFTADLFTFLKQLKKNNNRDWFLKNKARYDEIRLQSLRLIEDFRARLYKISPHFLADARPVGGSLFRIYRDVRFSEDNRLDLGGESLKRPPKGYDADHPWIEDLKRKDFISSIDLSEKQIVGFDFPEVLQSQFQKLSPFVFFLSDALKLPR